jgi:hypothetical protein
MLRIVRITVILFLAFSGSVFAADAAEPSFLIHSDESAGINADTLSMTGSVLGKSLDVKVYKEAHVQDQASLRIDVSVDGTKFGVYSIPLSKLPFLDIESTHVSMKDTDKPMILVQIRFSKPRDCYVNDDGRDRLTAVFQKGEPTRFYVINYEGCKVNVIQ